jgi:hypothetical protein
MLSCFSLCMVLFLTICMVLVVKYHEYVCRSSKSRTIGKVNTLPVSNCPAYNKVSP